MRIVWILFNAVVIYLGVKAIRLTDFNSPDYFYSATLPLIDMLFCIYLLIVVIIESWRATD